MNLRVQGTFCEITSSKVLFVKDYFQLSFAFICSEQDLFPRKASYICIYLFFIVIPFQQDSMGVFLASNLSILLHRATLVNYAIISDFFLTLHPFVRQ